VTAGGFLTMVLPIIVFLAMQRYFVRGLTAGAVTGGPRGLTTHPRGWGRMAPPTGSL
jgi:hypothetical protein